MKKLDVTAINKQKQNTKGQALITLLFFIVIAITVTSASVVVLASSSLSANKLEDGTTAYYAAESGVEDTLIQLLRNPSYSGETIQVDNSKVTITVTQGNPITILSVGQNGNFIRKIQVQAVYTNNLLTVSSWNEVY